MSGGTLHGSFPVESAEGHKKLPPLGIHALSVFFVFTRHRTSDDRTTISPCEHSPASLCFVLLLVKPLEIDQTKSAPKVSARRDFDSVGIDAWAVKETASPCRYCRSITCARLQPGWTANHIPHRLPIYTQRTRRLPPSALRRHMYSVAVLAATVPNQHSSRRVPSIPRRNLRPRNRRIYSHDHRAALRGSSQTNSLYTEPGPGPERFALA